MHKILWYEFQCEDMDSSNGKVYYRRAQARIGLKEIDEPLEDLKRAMALLPNNQSIKDLFKVAKSNKMNHLKKEKDLLKKLFS